MKIPFTKYEFGHIRKALTAGGLAAVALLIPDLSDGHLSQTELVVIGVTLLVTAATTFGVPNRDLEEVALAIEAVDPSLVPAIAPIVATAAPPLAPPAPASTIPPQPLSD